MVACDPDYSVIDLLLCGWAKPVGRSIAELGELFSWRFPRVLGIGAPAIGWQESIFSRAATCIAAYNCPKHRTTVNDVESSLDIVVHTTLWIIELFRGLHSMVDGNLSVLTCLLGSTLADLRRST